MATSSSTTTRELILDAAEQLFAQQGHDNTSMRQITSAAGVNLAAINYHFGSKDGLVQAVFQRRVAALNKERLMLLDALEAQSGSEALKPSQIVEAFFGPLVRHACSSDSSRKAFVPLLERSMSDPGGFIRAAIIDEHSEVLARFKQALVRALPDVPEIEMIWRFHFMLGATSYAITGAEVLRSAMSWTGADDNVADPARRLLDRLLSFLLGGLRAPLPEGACITQANPPA
ncbi:TetR/AcrR family transcriptional regulator [Allopusillimonas ginsengisoli]|uniref:TetR/AcrR family transcriptional regulator n=1 Tax=Allopusillimonas ginsengisoli TaxID=453575 RepID=UPI00102098D8|nr:TetR/AcrR family transcriptional regulator [Allopusillimonas ginsengisoli]TEA76817.1 TetR/AcrR family transcriptional regulator [Allopusillimonas ginsengisoli]